MTNLLKQMELELADLEATAAMIEILDHKIANISKAQQQHLSFDEICRLGREKFALLRLKSKLNGSV